MAESTYRIPPVGERFILARDVYREPYFIADKGMSGTVTKIERGVITAKIDQPLVSTEDFGNCVQWDAHPDSDPRYDQDVEVINDSVWCTGCGRIVPEPFAEHVNKCPGEAPEPR